ncbi:MAG TPA: type II toxin-antitoxin system RelE/ParE family toxin [Chloroflexia bacterium]
MPEPEYSITFARSAQRELEGLPASVIRRVFPQIEGLAHTPRPAKCRKIAGAANLWRIRVGDYRVIYEVADEAHTVDIIAIRHRSQAYR